MRRPDLGSGREFGGDREPRRGSIDCTRMGSVCHLAPGTIVVAGGSRHSSIPARGDLAGREIRAKRRSATIVGNTYPSPSCAPGDGFKEADLRGIDYAAVRAAIDIRAVLDLIGFKPTSKRGEQWRGPCPLHGSQATWSRTFSVNVARGVYRCFKCGRGGNALDLWAEHTGQALYEATIDLCEQLGVAVPWVRPPRRR